MEIVERAKEFVGEKRGNMSRLADAAGMRVSTLNSILKGDSARPLYETVMAIGKGLDKLRAEESVVAEGGAETSRGAAGAEVSA